MVVRQKNAVKLILIQLLVMLAMQRLFIVFLEKQVPNVLLELILENNARTRTVMKNAKLQTTP